MCLCLKIHWWIHLIGCWCVNSIGDGHGKWLINNIKYSSFSIYYITSCLVVTIGVKPICGLCLETVDNKVFSFCKIETFFLIFFLWYYFKVGTYLRIKMNPSPQSSILACLVWCQLWDLSKFFWGVRKWGIPYNSKLLSPVVQIYP